MAKGCRVACAHPAAGKQRDGRTLQETTTHLERARVIFQRAEQRALQQEEEEEHEESSSLHAHAPAPRPVDQRGRTVVCRQGGLVHQRRVLVRC